MSKEHASETAQLLSQLNEERERVKEVEGMLAKASSHIEGRINTSSVMQSDSVQESPFLHVHSFDERARDGENGAALPNERGA